MESAHYFWQILIKFKFSPHIFEKYANNNFFLQIRTVATELFLADGQTYEHDEANTLFSKFCECA
jgi:hypothetical protein